uniref:Uncharacterized protein n=1 Tax=Setaria digitata TaxID=48799 RepID=A0A915PSR6_9BILA
MYSKYQESELIEMKNSADEKIQSDTKFENISTISNNKFKKKHEELLKSSEEILYKLEKVRQTKAYEMMKYEKIARMNASSVAAYLRQQRMKPNDISTLSQKDMITQKRCDEIRNHAATIIQRFFHRIIRQKQIDRLLCTWKWIPIKKRIKYIEAIAVRMSDGVVPRRIDHLTTRDKLEEHRRTMYTNVCNYIRREQLIHGIKRDLKLLNGKYNSEEFPVTTKIIPLTRKILHEI